MYYFNVFVLLQFVPAINIKELRTVALYLFVINYLMRMTNTFYEFVSERGQTERTFKTYTDLRSSKIDNLSRYKFYRACYEVNNSNFVFCRPADANIYTKLNTDKKKGGWGAPQSRQLEIYGEGLYPAVDRPTAVMMIINNNYNILG